MAETDLLGVDPDAILIDSILAGLGITAELVPQCNEKTCDLRAHDENERYLIEVKAFHEIEATKTRKSRFLFRKKSDIDTVRDRSTKAVRQIRATARRDDELCLQAWIRHSSRAPEVHTMILGALYGARMVLQTAMDGVESRNVCLYFSHSEFFKRRNLLDGVIVLDSGRAEFHLNDHSDRFMRAGASGLARAFLEKNALRDASTIAREHAYLIADCGVDRNDEQGVCGYLERKYHLKRVIRWHSIGFEGIDFVPFDAE